MRFQLFISSILLSIAISCSPASVHESSDVLHKEVMKIHDEVMPKMRDINQLKKKLRQLEGDGKDSLIQRQVRLLDEADEAMMAWMAQYKRPSDQDTSAANAYLRMQKSKIQDVKDLMLSTIRESQHMIEK